VGAQLGRGVRIGLRSLFLDSPHRWPQIAQAIVLLDLLDLRYQLGRCLGVWEGGEIVGMDVHCHQLVHLGDLDHAERPFVDFCIYSFIP